MTLYVKSEIGTGGIPDSRPASHADRLRDRGWVECVALRHLTDLEIPADESCPDCVDGLVPPDGMIYAAVEGMWDSHGKDYSIRQARRDVLPEYTVMARAALVEAARWEKE